MPLVRSGQERHEKWVAKYNPTVVSTRFTDVESVAKARAQDGLGIYADLDIRIGSILDQHGVTGPDRAKYLAFARKVQKAALRVSGAALNTQVLGLKQYFITSYKCEEPILDAILQGIIGYVPTY
ncbi:hypothetical protein DRN38_00125 [Thermococci archaeon]|nr:MAG: hypothetical protein DRN38_00125 [Thermococci archaeon]